MRKSDCLCRPRTCHSWPSWWLQITADSLSPRRVCLLEELPCTFLPVRVSGPCHAMNLFGRLWIWKPVPYCQLYFCTQRILSYSCFSFQTLKRLPPSLLFSVSLKGVGCEIGYCSFSWNLLCPLLMALQDVFFSLVLSHCRDTLFVVVLFP